MKDHHALKTWAPLLLAVLLLAAPLWAEDHIVVSPETERSLSTGSSGGIITGAGPIPARQIFENVNPSCVTIATDSGMGSGFIVGSAGYVMTNWHVVFYPETFNNAETIRVRLHDGTFRSARIIKTDPELDLALLKIDGDGYSSVTIGDAHALAVGDTLYIIGAPHGLEHSMTTGIVSAVNRDRGRIQSSAVIHKGNSGGPVFNDLGQVVAVAVAAELSDQQAWVKLGDKAKALPVATLLAGVSYLIPINYARNLVELTQ